MRQSANRPESPKRWPRRAPSRGIECDWAAGFLRNSSGVFGPTEAAFGHTGWGGSFAFADPESGLTLAYTMNRMDANLRDDARAKALIGTV